MVQARITTPDVKERLEEIRESIENESVSYGELAELADLVDYIEHDDVVLLEWAGVDESIYNDNTLCLSMGCHNFATVGNFCNSCTK